MEKEAINYNYCRRKRTAKSNQGITLVALVVTIVVLLILAGITINLLFSDNGIIKQAQDAANRTKEANEQEEGSLKNAEEFLNYYANGIGGSSTEGGWKQSTDGETVTNGKITLKIGDYVEYDCKTGATTQSYTSPAAKSGWNNDQTTTISEYNYGWRVLGASSSGELLILSEDFIPITGGYLENDREYYYLQGQVGYVNGEKELENLCKIYGQGKGATGARSIKIEDIDKITGYNPNNIGVRDPSKTGSGTKCDEGSIYEYGNEVTYTRPSASTVNYRGSNGKEGTANYSQFTYYNGSNWISLGENDGSSITITEKMYGYYPQTLKWEEDDTATVGIATNSQAYKILFTNSSTGANTGSAGTTDNFWYWLGSSFVSPDVGLTVFGMRYVYDGFANGNVLYISYGGTCDDCYGVRPVVSLKSDIQLEKAGTQKDNCDDWKIM